YISMVDSGNLAACLIALQRSLIDMTTHPVLRWSRWEGLRDALGNLGEALAALEEPAPSTGDELRATLRELEDEIAAVDDDPQQWIPALLRLNEYKMPDLISQLQTLLDTTDHHIRPATLRTLRIFVNRIHYQLADMQRELDRFAPWHRLFAQMPHAVRTSIAGKPALGDYFKTLQGQLRRTLSVADTPAACRAAEPLARALQEGLLADVDASARVVVEQWCNHLLTSLDTAHDAAQELMAMLDRVHQRAGAFVDDMDFGALYDAQRDVFHIGFNVDRGALDNNYYDLLASEARLGSLVAIAKHDVPLKHWVHLGRPLTVTPA
ncbi:MAG: hypothetical protein KDD83_25520, partial [Caldilineaceae bacterium]|nr:hypothetical protein [Caldilineaceae bacterium]